MTRFLVAGLINLETTLRVEGFPLPYYPVTYPFFGVNSTVSGVGYNLAKALTVLGNPVDFLSLIGQDPAALVVNSALAHDGIPSGRVLPALKETPQSVILYDPQGRRQIHVDLKDIQESAYPPEIFSEALAHSDACLLCNINFSRPFLAEAHRAGKPIASDVHAISDLDDPYNADYMAAAQVLFMSDERLPCSPEDWARRIFRRYGAEIIVIGLGQEGALLCVRRDNFIERIPAAHTRPVVNTIGAGDALFSAFVHTYFQSGDPYEALRRAVVFASWKIGARGAADGFLNVAEWNQILEG